MSLASITKETRVSLKLGAIIIAVLLFLFLFFKGGSIIYSVLFPEPPAPPEEKFGKLSQIIFPPSSNTIPQFAVNTVSGILPSFPTTIKVYKLNENTPTITALQTAQIKAQALKYTQNQEKISSDVYKWTKEGSNNFLTYNITSFNFSVDSDYLSDPTLTVGDLTKPDSLTNATYSFIDALGADRLDIDQTKSNITYYFINNGELNEVQDPTNASVAKVYLTQNPVDNIPIYYPTADTSLLYFILSGPSSSFVVSARYNHFSPDLSQDSTYPLKTAAQALNDLKNGKGYIVKPTSANLVNITNVSLGYYLSEDPAQQYLMPIIVFDGANNFRAYVNAIP